LFSWLVIVIAVCLASSRRPCWLDPGFGTCLVGRFGRVSIVFFRFGRAVGGCVIVAGAPSTGPSQGPPGSEPNTCPECGCEPVRGAGGVFGLLFCGLGKTQLMGCPLTLPGGLIVCELVSARGTPYRCVRSSCLAQGWGPPASEPSPGSGEVDLGSHGSCGTSTREPG
jgi:hypothetical protein